MQKIMTWSDYDPAVAEEWQRRRHSYARRSRSTWVVLGLMTVIAVSAVALVHSWFIPAFLLWLAAFGVLFVRDHLRIAEELTCPNCGRIPFISALWATSLVSTSNPKRCYHCGTRLRIQSAPPAAQPRRTT
jgi:hypothetical protein